MDPGSSTFLLLGPLTVLTVHTLLLRKVDIDHLAVPIIATSCVAYGLLVYIIQLGPATKLFASFWVSLWLWIGAYRAFFHPLRDYPGPFAAKLSKWWVVKQNWDTDSHFHRTQQQLQKEYGDYVRTGPRELTIFDVDALHTIYGGQSKTSKATNYDMLEKTVHMSTDKQFHRQRRRVWDNAFKATLSDLAPIIEEFTDQVLIRLRGHEGSPVPLHEYMSFYTYDTLATLAFGKPMGFIKGEQNDEAQSIHDMMNGTLAAFGLLQHLPWMLKAMDTIGSLAGPMKQWRDWSVSQMKARMAVKDSKPDLVSHLMDNTPNDAAGRALLYGESRLIITAGGETTSTALTFVFIHLATRPKYMYALRKELQANASTYHCQRSLPLLDAIINESMRLWPSVLLYSPRATPPEGLTINGHYVPGDMVVQVPPFPMFHDPRYFVDPDVFIPERWLDRPELVLRKDAFNPFMMGPYNCAGKGMAMMELRSVVSRVISEFDVKMPEGFDEEKFWNGIKDQATAGIPKQDVLFVKVEN